MSFNSNNLLLRVVSALVLIPLVILLTIKGGTLFLAMIFVITILMSYEWYNLINLSSQQVISLDKLFTQNLNINKWLFIGVIYITLPSISFILLRNYIDGLSLIIWLFLIVWSTDIAAYFIGSLFGGPKLMSRISPKKTISGAIGGIIAAIVISLIYAKISVLSYNLLIVVTIAAIISIMAQIGDLFESWVKRKVGAKDSGNIIPGHGGILDRVDALMFASPLMLIFKLLNLV